MSTSSSPTICYAAARSGGHIIPAITLAQDHKKSFPYSTTILITTNTELDSKIIDKKSCLDYVYQLTLINFPRMRLTRYPLFVVHVATACWNILGIFRKHRPQKIVCTGGHIALPICLAAVLMRIPVELYELNALPGKAIKTLAPLATTIACCFSEATQFFPPAKTYFKNYPIRFSHLPSDQLQPINHFKKDLKIVLILGGSQGSAFMNTMMEQLINSDSFHSTLQIIHQTGMLHLERYRTLYESKSIPAMVFGYTDQIQQYYQAADLIVCRSGAGTLFEALFFQKKCITIPLETATTDHQRYNAYAFARQYPQLITVLEQEKVIQEPTLFMHTLKNSLGI